MQMSKLLGERAIVIGGIAGLMAARVLADHFEQAVVLERDQIAEDPRSINRFLKVTICIICCSGASELCLGFTLASPRDCRNWVRCGCAWAKTTPFCFPTARPTRLAGRSESRAIWVLICIARAAACLNIAYGNVRQSQPI